MSETMLPCPFCGGEAELDTAQAYRALSGGSLGERAVVSCTRCGADMGFCYEDAPGTPREDIINQVVDDWNRRVVTRDVADFQQRVAAWCVTCFGETTAYDVTERNWRFLEEALELVQSLGGNADDAHQLVDYVFGRDAGEPHQEVGGTMVTLAALVAANNLSIVDAAFAELERIERPEVIDKIRRKHASKPHRSPLPDDYKHAREP